MIRNFHCRQFVAATVCLLAAFVAEPAFAARKTAIPTKEVAQSARPAGEIVEYAELEHRVGAQIVVETTLNTVRRGTLIKYTNPGLTLQLGAEAGSIELSVPRETVRSVRVLAPAVAAAAE